MRAFHVIAPSTPADTTRLGRVLRLLAALTALFLLVWRWPFHDPYAGATSCLPLRDLGLDRDNATSLMQDVHRKLMYLDPGLAPVPEAAPKECSEYCGLPCGVRPVSLEFLHSAIEEALLRRVATGSPT